MNREWGVTALDVCENIYIFSLNGEICKCFDVCKIKFKITAFNISTVLFPLIYSKSVSFGNVDWNFINVLYMFWCM